MFKIALFSGGFLLCYLLSGCTFVNSIIGPKDIQQDFEKISDISLPDINAADIIPTTDGRLIASGLVVVVFKEDVSLKTKKEAIDQWGGQLVGQIPQINTYYVKFLDLHTENKINQIIKQLSLDPTVAAVLPEYFEKLEEQSFIDSITDIESLDSPSKKWGFVKIQAPEAWSLLREGRINLSDNIVVGVIDTSFDLHHEELRQNFVMTLNGYPVHDFGDNDPDVSPDEIDPTYQNHGTFVAGIIASSINKNEINGVAPTVKIFPLKHSSHKWCFKPDTPPKIHFRCGKFTNAWIAAVVYAVDAGVDVINMSFGGLLPKRCDYYNWENDPRYKAIRYAREKGIMLIASAGNENADAVRNYPSCFKEVIAVGATNQNDERGVPAVPSWIGSNFSDEEDALWVAAPGVAIYSTASTKEKYKSDFGTSFAAPFVSGLAALLK